MLLNLVYDTNKFLVSFLVFQTTSMNWYLSLPESLLATALLELVSETDVCVLSTGISIPGPMIEGVSFCVGMGEGG